MKNIIKIIKKNYFLISSNIFLLIFFECFAPIAFSEPTFRESHPEVQSYIQKLSSRYGFSKPYLERVFDHVIIKKKLIHQYNQPLEQETWDRYRRVFFTEERFHKGALFWKQHQATLEQAEKQFQVPQGIIVATLGVETFYGNVKCEHRAIDAIANLAFGINKRKNYFKSELTQLFLLARDLQISPLKIDASYAGAIGLPQFMPSSYREFAIAYRHDHYPDLMHNPDDAIMSIANYYHQHGWHIGEETAIPSKKLSENFLKAWHSGKLKRNLGVHAAEKYGIVPKRSPNEASTQFFVLTLPRQDGDEYWLGFHNFKVIKRYNSSNLYAMAVYQLSEIIRMEKENF